MQLQSYRVRLPRTTSAQRQQWIEKYQKSGLSREAFARGHGLRLSTFYRWLAQAKLPEKIAQSSVAFQEIHVSPQLPAPTPWAMEVVTPGGVLVRLR